VESAVLLVERLRCPLRLYGLLFFVRQRKLDASRKSVVGLVQVSLDLSLDLMDERVYAQVLSIKEDASKQARLSRKHRDVRCAHERKQDSKRICVAVEEKHAIITGGSPFGGKQPRKI
jgi:hypothetical protein